MPNQDIHIVTLTSHGHTIGVYVESSCSLCGRSLELLASVRLWYEWTRLAKGGMLSSAGIEVLRLLKRLPCRWCLGAMYAAKLSTLCASSHSTERKERKDGTCYIERN